MFSPLWLWLWLVVFSSVTHATAVTVAAATSLRPDLERSLAEFRRVHGIDVRTVYAASGTLAQQLLHGAPYALFLSASPEFLDPLQQLGRICEGPVVIGHGRLVLYVPKQSTVSLDSGLKELDTQVLERLAIADPSIAPFGRLARQALERAGLWQKIRGRLVYGDSAAKAAQLALGGAVDAALLPQRLMRSPAFWKRGNWTPVDERLYRPVPIMAAWLCGGTAASKALYGFLLEQLGGR